MKKQAALGLFVTACLAQACGAQTSRPWQHLQFPTTQQVEAKWLTPPSAYGPEPYYGLNGPVTLKVVERDLDTMHRLGFRAVTMQAGRGMPYQYLSIQYFKFLRQVVEQARKRGMRVWIVDDAGYPSGFAGGAFTQQMPNLRMQGIEIVQTLHVTAGKSLHLPLDANAVSAAAANSDGQATPIPLHGRTLNWTAPAGSNWTVLIANHEFRTAPTRSATNPRNVKDTEQSVEDYMNPAATAAYIRVTHQQYKKYLGSEFGKTIMGFRGDEPDYSIAGLPWTPAFFARFHRLKGYDIRPYTALLAETPSRRHPTPLIHLTPLQQRIRADYYDVFSRMFAAGFFTPLGEWCKANHLEYQVHLNHEEREMELTHSEGSFFRDMRHVEVPGIDAIWHQIWTDTISNYPRLASSVAHVYGKPRAFTESFAAYDPHPDVKMARYILNEEFVRGVNLVEMMYFPATSRGPHPPPGFIGQPGFPALNTYVRRMSYLMSMGRPDASVALFLPSSAMWMDDNHANTTFMSAERLLSEHQVDFDIVSEGALAHDLIAGHGTFQTASGNRYRTVILPHPEVISAAMLARLKAFASGGGKVLFLGGTPSLISGRTYRYAHAATPSDFSWATVTTAQLSPTPVPPQFPPASPPAPQIVPAAVRSARHQVVSHATVQLDHPDRALRVMHRRWKNAEVYLLFNEGSAPLDREATLFAMGHKVQVWDPQTGQIHTTPFTRHGGHIAISLQMQPYSTRFIVVE